MSNPSPEQIIEIALAHHQAGRLPEAERLYRSVLDADPKNADALHYLGVMAGQIGRNEDAISYLEQARAQQPDNANIFVNLALTHLQLQQPDRAEEACAQALRLRPDWVEVVNILGNCQFQQAKFNDAIATYQRVIAMQPEFLTALSNLAAACKAKGDFEQALACARQVVQKAPDVPEAHNNLAIALAESGQFEEALAEAQRAVELNPEFAEGWNTLGRMLRQQGKFSDELACYQRAIAANVQEPAYPMNLAQALLEQGRVEESISILERTVQMTPQNARVGSQLLAALNYSPAHSARDIYEAHVAWAHHHADPLAKFTEYSNSRDAQRHVRVGYVSARFCRGLVGETIASVLTSHDRERFEIFCYSSTPRADELTARLRALPVTWREVSAVSDQHLCAMIRRDEIDVLIDLEGHGAGNRLLAFARRPAPTQMSWLGYPATTGMSEIDDRISDATADPPRMTERFYTETLVRLRGSFLCFHEQSPAKLEETPAAGRGFVTFGSFVELGKLNRSLVELWAKILSRVAGSRLLVSAAALADEGVGKIASDAFAAGGVCADRVELTANGKMEEVDVVLDSWPYGDAQVVSAALARGVPVVTLAGESFRSRMGASILWTVGLAECVAANEEEYVERAVKMAQDVAALDALRRRIPEKVRKSALVDAKPFTRELEQLYRERFERWRALR